MKRASSVASTFDDVAEPWRDAILDSIADGVFTVDPEWRVTYLNPAGERITGTSRAEAVGRFCFEMFRANTCEQGCFLRDTLATGTCHVNKEAYVVGAGGKRVPISISTAVLRDKAGRVHGGVETFRDMSAIAALRKELGRRYELCDVVSKSEAMQRVLRVVPQIAASEATVLVEGESGTGKELLARAIHTLSPRARGAWVAVNCAALPDALLESELFGHMAGAFTDAKKDRKGRFALADGGTIFLDEIGDVSPAMQSRLLRVLQERTIEPLGSSHPQRIDVRVIAATNKKLADLVASGRFRDDLYYRLAVVPITVPPLRERRDDVPLLVEHFIAHFNGLRGRQVGRMAPAALSILMNHDYPGNVRELMNIVEHAFVLCTAAELLPEHLPATMSRAAATPGPAKSTSSKQARAEAERRLISETLARFHNNRVATAQALGVHKTTLWRRMHELGIRVARGGG